MQQTVWSVSRASTPIGEKEVHVWRAKVPAATERLERLLSADERERCARFQHRDDQERCIVARALIRCLVGKYGGVDPAEITITHSEFGKPVSTTFPDIMFNVSHSGEWVIAAFTMRARIGVDVERIRQDIENEQLATRFFSGFERQQLSELPAQERLRGFFSRWVHKEAFIKALGVGLSFPLNRFSVAFDTNESPRLCDVADASVVPERWRLFPLDVATGYAAALAVENIDADLKFYEWLPENQ